MNKALALVPLLALTALAGCLGADDDGCTPGTTDADGVNRVRPTENVLPVDKDPWDFEATNYRTCTVEKVGHTPLRWAGDGMPDPHNYLGEVDMRGDLDLGAVAVLGNGEEPGIYLVDITERADPQVVSFIPQENTYITDVKFSDDGRYLFTASQTIPTVGETPSISDPTSPQAMNGFTVYDVSDATGPTYVTTVLSPDDVGCHMLDYAFIDDTHVVFCVGQHVNIFGLAEVGSTLVNLGAVPYIPDGTGGASPVPAGTPCDVILVGDVTGQQCSGPHDMTVTWDPVDERRYMVVSHWDEGVRVVDVTAPIGEGIQEVGAWAGEGADHYYGVVHTAMMFRVGDHRYIAATPEMAGLNEVPALWILDADDLSDLRLVGEWYHPSETTSKSLLMTLHQWQVGPTGADVTPEDVRFYITWNHNGVWVLEMDAILAGDLEGAIGGFHMSRAPLDEAEDVGAAVYSTWDVNLVDGYLYGSDRATGLWVFHYTPDTLGDQRLRGFA